MEQVQMGAFHYQLSGVFFFFFPSFFTQIIQHMFYSIAALIVICLMTWFDVWEHADIICANNPELVLSTITACIHILTSVISWAGVPLNNDGFLAWYTFLTWITFAILLIPGYLNYKHCTFNLEGKINAQWSCGFDVEDQMRVQNQLNCCGYFSPFIEATVIQTCYARTVDRRLDGQRMSSEALGNVKQHVSGMRDMHLPAFAGIVMDMGTGMALGWRVYSTCVEHSDSELFGTNTHTW